MRLDEIHDEHEFHGDWCLNENPLIWPGMNQEELLAAYQPKISFNLREQHGVLAEATYKELATLIDPDFLKQGIRAAQLEGIRLENFDPEDTMNFYVNSSEFEKNQIQYLNQVKFDEFEQIGSDPEFKTAREKALMLLWVGNIKLHCSCPSQIFWGYSWLLTVLDSSIYPETRRPIIRNPHGRGICCKHLHRILKVLPFYSADLGSHIKRTFGS